VVESVRTTRNVAHGDLRARGTAERTGRREETEVQDDLPVAWKDEEVDRKQDSLSGGRSVFISESDEEIDNEFQRFRSRCPPSFPLHPPILTIHKYVRALS
jgi:hypothetical protein